MTPSPSKGGNGPRPPLSDEALGRLLDVQVAELQLRRDELAIRQQELKQDNSFAEKALSTQERDRKDERMHQATLATRRYAFAAAVIVAVLVFAAVALLHDKDQIVLEIVKVVLFTAVGGFGGYHFGKQVKTGQSGRETG